MQHQGRPTDAALLRAHRSTTALALLFTVVSIVLYVAALASPGLTKAPLIGVGATGQLIAAVALWVVRSQIKSARRWHRREQAATQGVLG